jgi:hypothetical protein
LLRGSSSKAVVQQKAQLNNNNNTTTATTSYSCSLLAEQIKILQDLSANLTLQSCHPHSNAIVAKNQQLPYYYSSWQSQKRLQQNTAAARVSRRHDYLRLVFCGRLQLTGTAAQVCEDRRRRRRQLLLRTLESVNDAVGMCAARS